MELERKWICTNKDPFTMTLIEEHTEKNSASPDKSFEVIADVVDHEKGFMCLLAVDPLEIDARFASKWLADGLQQGIEEVHEKLIVLGLQ